jgi:hypothetical protein
MMEIPAKILAEELNNIAVEIRKGHYFVAVNTFDATRDLMEEINDSWIVKVAE